MDREAWWTTAHRVTKSRTQLRVINTFTVSLNSETCIKIKNKEMPGECMLLGSLSRHNKNLEWRTLKPSGWVTALGSWTDRVIALSSPMDLVTALK